MKNDTIGLEGLEVSELIRKLRLEKKIPQNILYEGLCKRKVYFQLENGEVIMDELLSERLFSRLHVQYRLLDIMLSDNNFWQKECRHKIGIQMRKGCWEKAECLLKEYELRAPQTLLHKQYMLAKDAELKYLKGEKGVGNLFREALELSLSVQELECRLVTSGVVSEEELRMYFYYRFLEKPFSEEEYTLFLERVAELFLSVQIYAEVYFDAAYQYVYKLLEEGEYAQCRKICSDTIAWLKRGVKNYYLADFYYVDAWAGMKQEHNKTEEAEYYQQCKMAYYVSLSFGEKETAEKIKEQCKEQWGWHITD